MTEYTTYVTNGLPLWKKIIEMRPWVDEANAKRIAEEALAIPVSATERNRLNERNWVMVKHIWAEARKLKNA